MSITDQQIREAYSKTGNIWKAGEALGISGQSVHKRLVSLGIDRNNKKFSQDEINRLSTCYEIYRDAGNLESLATDMGRTKQFLCRKAKELGLTGHNKKPWLCVWKHMKEKDACVLFEKFKKSKLNLKTFCKRYKIGKSGFESTMKRFFVDEWDHVLELKVPKQSSYKTGRMVEYRVRDKFKEKGFHVLRAAGSKGPADLIAIKTGVLVFIQCKKSMAMGVPEWNSFYDLCVSVKAIPVLAGSPEGRGIECWLMTGRKDGTKSAQPKEIVQIDSIGNPRTEVVIDNIINSKGD